MKTLSPASLMYKSNPYMYSAPHALTKGRFWVTTSTILMVLVQLMLSGCQTSGSNSLSHLQQREEVNSTDNILGGGRISLFLNLKAPATQNIRMQIGQIDILKNETWLPVSLQPITISADEIGAGQVFLGRGLLPPGQYHRLRFTLQKASITKGNGDNIFLALDNPQIEIDLPATLDLKKGDSHSLFISWDEEGSMPNPPILNPLLAITPNLKQMSTDLAYAACPDIDTIYVMRTDKNWVCDSFGISDHPSNMTAIIEGEQKRLYILSPKEAEIQVIDLPANNVVSSFSP